MNLPYSDFADQLERAKQVAPDGSEYWLARDLQTQLTYDTWRSFETVLEKARIGAGSAGVDPANHFVQTGKMVVIGSDTQRVVADWFLSRYACYMIAMTADSSKPEVAHAQTYFAIQTRQKEIEGQLTELEKRELLRERVRDANKALNEAAHVAGVQRFGIFHDAGYKGLYGGLGVKAIKARKGLAEKDDLLDRAGRAELAANEFRITQTEEKIARDKISGEERAVTTHFDVALKVRNTIREIGGTMPENLPPETSLKKLTSANAKKLLKGKGKKES